MRAFRHMMLTNTIVVALVLVALTVDFVAYLKAGAGWDSDLWHVFVLLLVAVVGVVQGLRMRKMMVKRKVK